MRDRKLLCLALKCLALLFLLGAAAYLAAGFYSRHAEKNKIKIPDYVFTYAENQAEDYPTTQGALKFAELVKERTQGRIEILVYAGGMLGDENSIIEQVRLGGIDFARVSLSPLADTVPELNVLQLPFIYTSSEHMWRVLDGPVGEEIMNSFRNTGLTPLSWYDAGARNFYCADTVIRCLEDVRGLRIRVQESALMEDMVRLLGGTPVPMAYNEVYSALQTGTIDGAENNWSSYESERHYEVAKYYTVDEHARVPEVQLMSRHTWDKLTAEDQEIIRACARDSAVYERTIWEQRESRSKQKVLEEGCQIYEIEADERERFREAVTPLYESYCADDMDTIRAILECGS